MILPFSLDSIVLALSSETIYLRAYNAPTVDSNGIYAAPTYSTSVDVIASVQPADGASLKRLPEGYRSSDTLVVFCTTSLSDKDLVEVREGWYQVEGAADWYPSGKYYKALIRKLDASEVPSGL